TGSAFLRHKTFCHFETALFFVAPPACQPECFGVVCVMRVNEDSADAPRSGIEILIRTPAGKVDTPVVELERHITYSVCQVETGISSHPVSGIGNPFQIKKLTGVIIHATQRHHSKAVTRLLNGGYNIVLFEDICSF